MELMKCMVALAMSFSAVAHADMIQEAAAKSKSRRMVVRVNQETQSVEFQKPNGKWSSGRVAKAEDDSMEENVNENGLPIEKAHWHGHKWGHHGWMEQKPMGGIFDLFDWDDYGWESDYYYRAGVSAAYGARWPYFYFYTPSALLYVRGVSYSYTYTQVTGSYTYYYYSL